MADASNFAVFLTGMTLSASLILAIGAQNTFVLQQGLRREHVLAVVAVCALLDLALMAVGVGGVAATIGEHPRLLSALAIAGAALLAAYGIVAFRRAMRPEALVARTDGRSRPVLGTIARTLSISLLNPHVYLDTVVLIGAVGARQPLGSQWIFLLGAGIASTAWFFGLGFGARALAPLFSRPLAWRVLDIGVGMTMLALALRLFLGAFD
ncbi:LysE/ArgO family amino acid transporter [Variovorax sp. J22R24]|uniref:LysE/ArgO family amino acid transporter n=1 Tax=Variovorax gracilis TaxID=3053502 RepID=UPI00257668C7|nr:LysE/ArgO family amino acid transporter [Variovorax sp. J22R24]MDM0104591.1 LysE/ArgO family amino acid transporter [Variovorax sp. J22R24]